MMNSALAHVLHALDRIKPDLMPLPIHYMAHMDQSIREGYATLLAVVLSANTAVNNAQTRWFDMLLRSMQLEATTTHYVALAQHLDEQTLKAFVQQAKVDLIHAAFVLDALILTRLDAMPTDVQLQLLAEFCSISGLQTRDVDLLVDLCGFCLGCGSSEQKVMASLPRYAPFLKVSINPVIEEIWRKKEAADFAAGVWTDVYTGLVWARIKAGQTWVNGQVVGNMVSHSWSDAVRFCENLTLAGRVDWRLPRKEELESLRDRAQFLAFLRRERQQHQGVSGLVTVYDPLSFWTACEHKYPRQFPTYTQHHKRVYVVCLDHHNEQHLLINGYHSHETHDVLAVCGTTDVLSYQHPMLRQCS
jgi:hypothetical protein